jgi:integrase
MWLLQNTKSMRLAVTKFHNLRHSLSNLLIAGQKADVRTTQDILRHSNSATIEFYTQSPMAQRIAAQESVLAAIGDQALNRNLQVKNYR